MKKIKPYEAHKVIPGVMFKLRTGRMNSFHCIEELRNCLGHNQKFSAADPAVRKFLENELKVQFLSESEYDAGFFEFYIAPFNSAIQEVERFAYKKSEKDEVKLSRLNKLPLLPLSWTKSKSELQKLFELLVAQGLLYATHFNKFAIHWRLRPEFYDVSMAIKVGELEPLSTRMNGRDIVFMSMKLKDLGLVNDDGLQIVRHFTTNEDKLVANPSKVWDQLHPVETAKTALSLNIEEVMQHIIGNQSDDKSKKVQKTGIHSEYKDINGKASMVVQETLYERVTDAGCSSKIIGIGKTDNLSAGLCQENTVRQAGTGASIQPRRLVGLGKI